MFGSAGRGLETCQAIQEDPAVAEPEAETLLLSREASVDELREWVRSESRERRQLGMRLQKQQESLEEMSEHLKLVMKGGSAGSRISEPCCSNDGNQADSVQTAWANSSSPSGSCILDSWRVQMESEVELTRTMVRQLSQDLREMQESLGAAPAESLAVPAMNVVGMGRSSFSSTSSMLLDVSAFSAKEMAAADEMLDGTEIVPNDDIGELDGHERDASDFRWAEERFEELQNIFVNDVTNLERRLQDDFSNLKGFVDAAIVAMVSRLSTLECFIKGEEGLAERMESKLSEVSENLAGKSESLRFVREEVLEVTSRLAALEKSFEKQRQSSSGVHFSPSQGHRSPYRGTESVGTSTTECTHPGSNSDKAPRSVPHTGWSPQSQRLLAISASGGVSTPRLMHRLVQPCMAPPGVVNMQPAAVPAQMLGPLPGGRSVPQLATVGAHHCGGGSYHVSPMRPSVRPSSPGATAVEGSARMTPIRSRVGYRS